ncbi:MAG TPA: D-glycero-beta-D-manno-heptose-7-phosphate kinase [Pyrinomonadaceae bacterium]|nr:D-glycero-beta-D-manno-heptose-7-phosphate kinase [Pyrinomonadaceae bacterium]
MQILDNFSKLKILVVGDVMLDRYWWGSVTRISPEAPVPVVRLKNTSLAAGGAANVAVNVAGLGATAILLGVVGDDDEARLIPSILAKAGVSGQNLIGVDDRPTTSKTRIIAHSQQVVRVDKEESEPISAEVEDRICSSFTDLLPGVDAIAVSDYGKGVLTDRLLQELFSTASAQGKPVLVDPKGKNYSKYRGASVLTPNRREAAEACNLDDHAEVVAHAGKTLMTDLDLNALLITQGEEGMTLFRKSVAPLHLTAVAREVYDVTGAGDTVIATLTTAIGAGADLAEAARLANTAAGLVVEQVGTSCVSTSDLRTALGTNNSASTKS